MRKFCNDSRIVENVYKMFVFLKIFGVFGKMFENANVRQFCNDSRIVENVYKTFVFEKCFENSCFESVRCKDGFLSKQL